MRRVKYSPAAVFLLTNIAYLYILATVNSEISPYASLILPSVFIIGPALMLRGWQAALVNCFFVRGDNSRPAGDNMRALALGGGICTHSAF